MVEILIFLLLNILVASGHILGRHSALAKQTTSDLKNLVD